MKTMVSTAGSGPPGAIEISDVLLPGAKAGPWRIEHELGRGGMGAVYAVVHEHIGKRAALKVVHQRLLVPGFNSDRMLLEAKVVNQVGHPNIVDIFETGRLADGRPYIVMERLDGQSLSARADDSKLHPQLVIAILLQMCDALVAAHAAGVVHRDLKLDNVFLADNPEDPATPKVKLLDWGIAKVMTDDVKHTVDGQLIGTPQYLAPEQARGQAVSPQTDVYSLGVMAYELFLEQLPFEAETAAEVMAMHLRTPPPPPCELWPDVPPALQDLLLAMLAKSPAQRPTVPEVIRRLDVVRDELERRRQAHGLDAPCHATATPVDTSQPHRVISAAGLAPTELAAWRPGTKWWQYALGAFALAASATLFWLSRVVDQSASAATADASVRPADHHLASPRVGSLGGNAVTGAAQPMVSDIELRVNPALDAAGPPKQVAVRRLPVAAHPEVVPSRPSPVRATPPRATALPQPPARNSPAAPRRRARVDPDGTLEPYR